MSSSSPCRHRSSPAPTRSSNETPRIDAVGGAMTLARALRAQQKAMPVIGYLAFGSPGLAPTTAVFLQGLSETGWVEGQNVAIEYRWAEGRNKRTRRPRRTKFPSREFGLQRRVRS